MDNGDPSVTMDELINCNDIIFPVNTLEEIWSNVVYPQMDQTPPPDNLTTITGNIPSRDDFPGHYNFNFTLDPSTTGQHWVYSDPLKQLFIGMNKTLVMQFQVSHTIWAMASHFYIRALPVYSTDDYVNIPVNRCTFHSCEDDPHGRAHQFPGQCLCEDNNFVGHVVRAECNEAEYLYDPRSERHSVRVVVAKPQAGSEHIPIPYSFACKTSCPKGMQRRPIHVIFTLEDESGIVFGRQKLGVKICSCPKRDKKRQEDDYWTEMSNGGEKKRKRPITNEDLEQALINTRVKVEAVEPLQKEDRARQIAKDINDVKRDINDVKRLFSDISMRLRRIEENHEKFLNDRP